MRALLNSSRWNFERFLALALCLALVIAPPAARALGHSEDPQPVTAQNAQREFAGRLATLQAMLAEIGDAGPDAEQRAALAAEKQALIALDPAVRQEQAAIAQRLAVAGLPDVILARQAATADMHAAQFSRLMAGLDTIETARGAELAAALAATRDLLAADRPPAREPPADQPLPRQKRKQVAPVLDLSTLSLASAGIAAVPASPPTQADLDPTIDVQLTDEVMDLAASLGHSPLLIYRYVRDHVDFEAYLGSRKGSRETLLVGSGNDYDQASLLIALLRASNIPARYIAGEVYLPAGQVMNWLGVDDAATAASLLATAGMQATAYGDGYGNIVAIAFNHVWVAAYVPYGNYRGIANDDTGKMWVPLDPSLKAYDYAPAVDIPAAMGFNAEAFIDSYITTMHEPSPVELYLQQIEAWMATNRPDLAYPDDAFRARSVVPDTLELLPASPPFIVLSKDAEYAEIPASARHRIRFVIEDNYGYTLLDHTVNLPTIASRRVTISYIPATPADEATIASYGDLYLTPPNLIHLKPVLRVDGAAVATGGSIAAGISHYSDMHFLPPSGDSNEVPAVYNNITAGAYQGIGIDTYRVGMGIFVPATDGALPDTDGITGEKLYRTAMAYLDRVDQADRTIAETMQMAFTTSVSEAIVENVITVWTSYGTPVDWEWRGLIVDADRKIIGPFSAAGDTSEEKAFMVLAGADGSISENRIFEDSYGEEAVSTIKILELSSDQGIPICRIQTSIAADCPGMAQPSSVVNAINNALAQGHHVTIPRTGITYYQWQGTGYIDMEPATGAAGYIIAGGQSGGATVDIWVAPWNLIFATIFRDVCSITANITYPAEGDYFPYPGFWSGLLHPQPPRFDVDYTVSYCDDGSKVVNESFRPHYQYGPGDYTFYAGWGTGATRNFTIFGAEVETPDDAVAFKGGDSITLNAKGVPRLPPGATFQWTKYGSGDGAFNPADAQTTKFSGTVTGEPEVKVAVANSNGTTTSPGKKLFVAEVTDVTAEGAETIAAVAGGTPAMKHFVSPKGTGSMTLKATVNPNTAEVRAKVDWENATEDAGNPLSATVSRTAAAEITVKIKIANQDARTAKAWVVWANLAGGVAPPVVTAMISTEGLRVGTRLSSAFNCTATIVPASITTSADRPDLSGANTAPPPGGTNSCGDPLSGGADHKWDMTRRIAIRAETTAQNPPLALPCVDFTDDYPANQAEGNDDAGTGDENNNPYGSGVITSVDTPSRSNLLEGGNVGATYRSRLWFQEFARFELNGNWYVVSDPLNWRVDYQMIKRQVTEALWNLDANGDGDQNDDVSEAMLGQDTNGDGDQNDMVGYWDNNGSSSANDNADLP